MRKEIYRMDRAAAVALLARAPHVRLATTTTAGEPVLRTMHAVVVDGALTFHAAAAGEKLETIGRAVVIAAEEVITSIPSYFVDPERACPATSYYLSAQLHGRIERIDDLAAKARVLTALMAKYQPEGGFRTIDAQDRRYRGELRGILVLAVPLERVDGKAKLGQNRSPEVLGGVLGHLWRRGGPGDLRAIDLVRDANAGVPLPAALRLPGGAEPRLAPGAAELDAACDLLDGAYWLVDVPRDVIARAHRKSPAWIAVRGPDGAVIASARACGDGARVAWIYDVIVHPDWRGRGLGEALVRLLLDHPAVRGARTVRLGTRDAQPLYQRMGFVETARAAEPFPHSEMALRRDPSPA
jgi:GNAT superfamily N-acetyltransferase